MLFIRQLIKALRKQHNSTVVGGDFLKSIKHSVMCGNNTTETTIYVPAETTFMTSLYNNENNENFTTPPSSLSVRQQQTNKKSSGSSCTTSSICTSNNTSSQLALNQQTKTHASHNKCFSIYSPLNAVSSKNKYSRETVDSSTQDSDLNKAAVFNITTTTNSHIHQTHHINHHHYHHQQQQPLQRSQRIQNFFQHQIFHQFHTQHNKNLNTKQNQTQFAMSSLAAKPITLQKSDGQIVKEDCYGTIDSESSSTIDSESSSSAASCPDTKDQKSSTRKPCFNTGLPDILQFMELIGNLKHTKRTGWVLRDVNDCESISGHMYRMSILTFLLDGSEGLNQIRCMELALVHDLAESLVGDITPFCGVSKEEKKNMELKAMEDICKLIEPRGKRIMELFEEYENGESAESKFVKDLDRLDMVMQAFEYEKRDDCLLKHQEFFDSTEGKFNHPFVKKLVTEIYEQRDKLAKSKGAVLPPKIEVPNMDLAVPLKTTAVTSNGHCANSDITNEKTNETKKLS